MNYKILIAEDDKEIIELLFLYLDNAGYEVVSATNGADALTILQNTKIDLAILDIMMPKLNGYELTKKIRENSNIPIIMLSAKSLDNDKIIGLQLGADDYLTKPFNPLEVVTRVDCALRRYYLLNDSQYNPQNKSEIVVGELILNTDTLSLKKNGIEIILTPTEYKILTLLMKSPGRVYTKIQIYQHLNGDYFENDDNTLMVHISNLREKIEDTPKNPKYIKTIRGLGYKIEKI
ncbi:MAG: response regulator transcription factor [Cellulosilyticaceae bacterium]